jgi:hypothetical protein
VLDDVRTGASKVKAEVRVPTTAETVTAKVLLGLIPPPNPSLRLVLLYGLHASAVSLLHAAVRQRLELKRMDGVASTVAKFRPMFVTIMPELGELRGSVKLITGASNEKAPANVPTTAPIDTAT